jgi:hypothetical protein
VAERAHRAWSTVNSARLLQSRPGDAVGPTLTRDRDRRTARADSCWPASRCGLGSRELSTLTWIVGTVLGGARRRFRVRGATRGSRRIASNDVRRRAILAAATTGAGRPEAGPLTRPAWRGHRNRAGPGRRVRWRVGGREPGRGVALRHLPVTCGDGPGCDRYASVVVRCRQDHDVMSTKAGRVPDNARIRSRAWTKST